MMSANQKPLLPSLASLLTRDVSSVSSASASASAPASASASRSNSAASVSGSATSASASPFLESYGKNSFRSDAHGVIRLPPLSATFAARPRSVESALRQGSAASVSATGLPSPAITPSSSVSGPSALPTSTITNTTTLPQLPTPDHESRMVQPPSPRHMNQKFAVQTPSTPVVKAKHAGSKKVDMLTPFTAVKASITPSSNEKKRAFAFITHSQDTFGVKEPKIDNAPLARRKRRRTSVQELNILQAGFDSCPTPDKKQRMALAERCSMTEKAVQIWFQNKRQAVKRQRLALAKQQEQEEASKLNDSHSTPLVKSGAIETDTPVTSSTPYNKDQTTPTRKTKGFTPTKRSPTPTRGRGQALTFHLKTDKKILTPVKTSPNNKVNKLINGYNDSILNQHRNSSSENKFHHVSPSKKGSKSKLEFRASEQTPLKELNPNVVN